MVKQPLSELAPECFVEFATSRLSAPVLAWINRSHIGEGEAFEHAYCVPLLHEDPAAYLLVAQRVQLADRYGGGGIGYCGGSARCGTYGDIQVKGIGKNPLHGARPNVPDPSHSTGTLDVTEAGREAIWSTICEVALPFGAVPNLAILLTGTGTRLNHARVGGETAGIRALLLRRPAIRPAHFMRNIYFEAVMPSPQPHSQDSVRTSLMINRLPAEFVKSFKLEVSDASLTNLVNQGLRCMAKRFATQAASSFAKRIFHGALGCSNIALDGRYLDFGAMTSVSGYRRRSGSPASTKPDFWIQNTQLAATLGNLHAHVWRYLKCPDIANLINLKALEVEFTSSLQSQLEIEFVKLSGIPSDAIESYPPERRARAFRCFKEVYARGATTPFVCLRGDNDLGHIKPLPLTGKYDLNHLLMLAARCSNAADLHQMLLGELGDEGLANELASIYTDMMNWYLERVPDSERAFAREEVAHQSQRLNADVSFLDRETLIDRLAACEHDPDGLRDFINETIQRATWILADQPAP